MECWKFILLSDFCSCVPAPKSDKTLTKVFKSLTKIVWNFRLLFKIKDTNEKFRFLKVGIIDSRLLSNFCWTVVKLFKYKDTLLKAPKACDQYTDKQTAKSRIWHKSHLTFKDYFGHTYGVWKMTFFDILA